MAPERILNRFRNFNIAHFALKIKQKKKSFILKVCISAGCEISFPQNYAVCIVFVTFRYRSIIFSFPYRFLPLNQPAAPLLYISGPLLIFPAG